MIWYTKLFLVWCAGYLRWFMLTARSIPESAWTGWSLWVDGCVDLHLDGSEVVLLDLTKWLTYISCTTSLKLLRIKCLYSLGRKPLASEKERAGQELRHLASNWTFPAIAPSTGCLGLKENFVKKRKNEAWENLGEGQIGDSIYYRSIFGRYV